MRKVLTALTLVGALAVSACNTIAGAGKDVSSAGNTVSKTAEKSK